MESHDGKTNNIQDLITVGGIIVFPAAIIRVNVILDGVSSGRMLQIVPSTCVAANLDFAVCIQWVFTHCSHGLTVIGTTSEFCGSKTVTSPSCSGSSSDARTVGYYEGWNLEHNCDSMTPFPSSKKSHVNQLAAMKPSQIPLGYYTHLNFAFAYIDPDSFQMAPMASDVAALYENVTILKQQQADLKVWISIGGWAFNDDDQSTATTFSDLAASESAQKEFFASLITFLVTYNFDGVDIDWYDHFCLPRMSYSVHLPFLGSIQQPKTALEEPLTIKTSHRSSRI